MEDPLRWHSPAAERNRVPIGAELQRLLPEQGLALEIASGTGQHAAYFATALSGWTWLPTDLDPGALASIDAWCTGLPNVRPAQPLDVLVTPWAGVPPQVDAIFSANMLHIAPWATCAALMQGAARHLAPHGLLLTYGPYIVDGEPTAPSNLAFDADLKQRNPAWGLRRLADVEQQAHAAGLRLRERTVLPANNFLLVFTHTGR
jgi:cyclopropane fatty-acyl-phospholipid synthase-like methyltransferase